jgi:hypothetical protein
VPAAWLRRLSYPSATVGEKRKGCTVSFFEKVKGQAKGLKEKVGEKVEDVQGRRKADDLLDDLGRFLYAERTDRAIAGATEEIDRIVGELKKLEDEGIKILPES